MKRTRRLTRVSAKERRIAPVWRRVKKQVRARSGGRCEVVLSTSELENWMWHQPDGDYERFDWTFFEGPWGRCLQPARDVHHLTKRSQGRDDSPRNLLHVCRKCHDWFDRAGLSSTGRLMAAAYHDDRPPRCWVQWTDKFEARREGADA